MNAKALIMRFIKSYITSFLPVVGDAVGAYSTFRAQPYALDLALWQFRMRATDVSLKAAAIDFLLQDRAVKGMVRGVFSSGKGYMNGGKKKR